MAATACGADMAPSGAFTKGSSASSSSSSCERMHVSATNEAGSHTPEICDHLILEYVGGVPESEASQ